MRRDLEKRKKGWQGVDQFHGEAIWKLCKEERRRMATTRWSFLLVHDISGDDNIVADNNVYESWLLQCASSAAAAPSS